MQMTWGLGSNIAVILFVIAVIILNSAVRIFREYERGVVFTLGRFWKVRGPGLVLIIP
ncbi:MAG: slipin family protein, partial [Burkholderiaceae bacterium]